VSACEACGKPADDDQVPGLCRDCAARIDRETDELLERELFDPGAGWDG
jgi:NMD protein affecting ribosome stability and mRNA decay